MWKCNIFTKTLIQFHQQKWKCGMEMQTVKTEIVRDYWSNFDIASSECSWQNAVLLWSYITILKAGRKIVSFQRRNGFRGYHASVPSHCHNFLYINSHPEAFVLFILRGFMKCVGSWFCFDYTLTNWSLHKMAANLQRTFSHPFSLTKMFQFQIKPHMLASVQVMA